MIQPQFNQNVPPVNELWKDEKGKYRHWIIILGIGILVMTALIITSFTMGLLDKANILDSIKKDLSTIYKSGIEERANSIFSRTYIIFPAIQIVAMLVGLVLYIGGTYRSYKEKNFARLSNWPTFIVGLGALLGFINIMQLVFSGNTSSAFSNSASLFSFINYIIFILIYFAASAPVSRLRRTFLISERMEKLKNDPQYQNMQQQFNSMMGGQAGAMGPFGPAMGGMNSQQQQNQQQPKQNGTAATNQQNPNGQQNVTPNAPIVNPTKKKLQGMTVSQLQEVAKELSISGYEVMKKKELIDSIMRISDNS